MSKIQTGDCLEKMARMKPSSIHAIVTDPPYGLSFMGKGWDHGVPGVPFWTEALRVLKPGGHLLAFGSARTYHRLACAIEDSGFEIRDCLMWLYGSGFPKSLNVGKAIDKAAGKLSTQTQGFNVAGGKENYNPQDKSFRSDYGYHYVPATSDAKRWNGYGTALKPAWEPIILARKSLEGTVAQNVLKHGCGALNVDGCRVGVGHAGDSKRHDEPSQDRRYTTRGNTNFAATPGPRGGDPAGRWPANLMLDEGAAEMLGDTSRFFYCSKANKKERGEGNTHPTVKPIALMRWLVRLVTPPGGTVLDPFAGSGTTGIACDKEKLSFLGIELSQEYVDIANARLKEKR